MPVRGSRADAFLVLMTVLYVLSITSSSHVKIFKLMLLFHTLEAAAVLGPDCAVFSTDTGDTCND